MNYQEALNYLYSFLDSEAKLPRRPVDFNLPRARAVLALFGNPHQQLRSVVVAGTKGKGSTSVMIEAIARSAGLHVGLWTSPHLHSYRERIQVDRIPISREALVVLVETLQSTIEQFDSEQFGTPSVFELGFALALRYFVDRRVDLAVIEVGLGGRYDAANVVTPLVSVITAISYDHMQTLGDTLGKIAYEKAGIAKPGVPLITGAQPEEALTVIQQVCAEVGAPLIMADLQEEPPPTPRMAGLFQRDNARIALAVARQLRAQGLPLSEMAIADGLAQVWWPGRMEIIAEHPAIVVDGAHNGESAERLVESIDALFGGKRIVLIFGTTRDKDVAAMNAVLMPRVSALVLTHSRHPRAEVNLAELAQHAEPLLQHGDQQVPILLTDDIPEAIAQARQLAGPDDLIVITGSLFVVAAAREALGVAEEVD